MVGKKGFQKGHPAFHINQKGFNLGEKSGMWKGNEVGYGALHSWIGRRLGKASSCILEDLTCKGVFDWANIDGEYKRDLNDFIPLCRSHHTRFDYNRRK